MASALLLLLLPSLATATIAAQGCRAADFTTDVLLAELQARGAVPSAAARAENAALRRLVTQLRAELAAARGAAAGSSQLAGGRQAAAAERVPERGPEPEPGPKLPSGSYLRSCAQCRLSSQLLTCRCAERSSVTAPMLARQPPTNLSGSWIAAGARDLEQGDVMRLAWDGSASSFAVACGGGGGEKGSWLAKRCRPPTAAGARPGSDGWQHGQARLQGRQLLLQLDDGWNGCGVLLDASPGNRSVAARIVWQNCTEPSRPLQPQPPAWERRPDEGSLSALWLPSCAATANLSLTNADGHLSCAWRETPPPRVGLTQPLPGPSAKATVGRRRQKMRRFVRREPHERPCGRGLPCYPRLHLPRAAVQGACRSHRHFPSHQPQPQPRRRRGSAQRELDFLRRGRHAGRRRHPAPPRGQRGAVQWQLRAHGPRPFDILQHAAARDRRARRNLPRRHRAAERLLAAGGCGAVPDAGRAVPPGGGDGAERSDEGGVERRQCVGAIQPGAGWRVLRALHGGGRLPSLGRRASHGLADSGLLAVISSEAGDADRTRRPTPASCAAPRPPLTRRWARSLGTHSPLTRPATAPA